MSRCKHLLELLTPVVSDKLLIPFVRDDFRAMAPQRQATWNSKVIRTDALMCLRLHTADLLRHLYSMVVRLMLEVRPTFAGLLEQTARSSLLELTLLIHRRLFSSCVAVALVPSCGKSLRALPAFSSLDLMARSRCRWFHRHHGMASDRDCEVCFSQILNVIE